MKAILEIAGFAVTDLIAGAVAAVAIMYIGIQSPYIAIVLALVMSALFAYAYHLTLSGDAKWLS